MTWITRDIRTEGVHMVLSAIRRAGRLGAMTAGAALVAGVLAAPAATAAGGSLDSPQREDFYSTPAGFDAAAPGDVLRSEPMTLFASFPLPAPWQAAEARRIMYRSTDALGAPIAVSGTYMRASTPWTGKGPRPLVSLAPGTEGQGDQCAPSKSFENGLTLQTAPLSLGAGYEILAAWSMLARGFDVVVTDYEGLGTEGVHTYVDRASQAHTVLDASRAALRLPGTELTPRTPITYSGYSQGGGAVAAAAEEAPRYAPELNNVGAAASAPPADLMATVERIDSSSISGAMGYAINGMMQTRPSLRPVIDAALNDRGRALLDAVSHECIGDSMLTFGLRSSRELTRSGQSAAELLRDTPELMKVVDEQRIGRLRPAMPVRVQGNVNDDAVPYGQVVQLSKDWCALGAQVTMVTDTLVPILPRAVVFNHLGPMLMHYGQVGDYLVDRVNGVPAPVTCG